MPRFTVPVANVRSLTGLATPAWKVAPAYTVEHYLETDWERPVRMLLRNHFTFRRTEVHSGSMMSRAVFEDRRGNSVILYHRMRHAEFRINRDGQDEVREAFIDPHRLYRALRQHFSFETGRVVA